MAMRRSDKGISTPAEPGAIVHARRSPVARLAILIGAALLVLLLVAVVVVWVQRKPIATRFLQQEFERRGVATSYTLDRVGFRTQKVSNLVIGDPRRPDLVARTATIQMRIKLDGSVEVYRIVARGVRLRGRMVGGKVRWGQLDKLLPPPSDKPFKLPSIALDIADSTIALTTPFGPVGVALHGNGNLRGGFKGRVAFISPRLVPGRCRAERLTANVAVAVVATRPHIDGPVAIDRFDCPASRIAINAARFDAKASFNESFTSVDGEGRLAIASLVAGANGLANFGGVLTYKGPLDAISGDVRLSAQNSRLATIYADRTRLDAQYRLGIQNGTLSATGKFAANSAALDPAMIASVTGPLDAAASTPIGPVAKAMVAAIRRTTRDFDIAGEIRVINFPGGGAVRIGDSMLNGPDGARVRISGGSGVTYYWPKGGLRIDSNIETAGGGLPKARISLRQAGAGQPISGMADIAPYRAGQTVLSLATLRFAPGPGNSTRFSTIAQLDGPFPDGRVRALRLPLEGRIGQGGSFALGTRCVVVSVESAQFGALQIGRTRLPVCPTGPAIITKQGSGPVMANARLGATAIQGRLGSAPFQLSAAGARFAGERFTLSNMAARIGQSTSPIVFDAARFDGNFAGSGISGTFAGAKAVIGNVPLLLDEGSGKWRTYRGDISVDANALVSDRGSDPRFYPLRTNDLKLTIANNEVRANGTLVHPGTGNKVVDVDIDHSLRSGSGHADLRVPGLTFGPGFQPDDLTRLTQGVVALVQGTISGAGRIDWRAGGKVSSTGEFATSGMDLAAPFGPIQGMSGTIRFSDLLAMTTEPGQTLTLKSVNPGILVENGVVRYQLLPGQLVRIERGEWPFMGGTLVLRETVLNFNRPTAKRLTFEVIGLDAHAFVSSMGFKELDATGTFDGVLPMIFDENGGRIVGGRLDSRPGGGSIQYNGVVNKADLGTMGNIVFSALRDLRFRTMVIRLDGDLAGEFAARLAVDGVAIGQSNSTQRFIRSMLAKLPLQLNVNITGPFRALIATAKSFQDPRRLLDDVLDRPLDDIPGITTEVRRIEEDKTQTQTPVEEQVAPQPASTER
ncbi:MAG: YdbH domain-containing protein [Sphingomicrobium sp.]